MKKGFLQLFAAALACLLLLTACGAETEQREFGGEEETEKTSQVEVYCLTEITRTYGEETERIIVSYETDGVHMKQEVLVDAYVELFTPDGREVYSIYYNEEGVQRYRIDNTYDKNGLKNEELQTNLVDNKVASRNTYTYDDGGHLLRVDENANNDLPDGYETYTYDDRGFSVSYDYFDRENTNLWHYDYTCDDSGRIVTGTICYPLQDNQLTQLGYYTCTYDDAGRLVSRVWTTKTRSYFAFEDYYYTYNEAGRLASAKIVDDDGEVDSETVYTYDDRGHLLSIVDAVEGSSVSFTYGTMELSADLAEIARAWSTEGVINYAAPMPKYNR